MGSEYMFKCKKCGYEYEISVGIGFLFLTAPHNELYVCKCCGRWKVVELPPILHNGNYELDVCDSSTTPIKCDGCGKVMEKIEADKVSILSCPKCETENEPSEIMMWD